MKNELANCTHPVPANEFGILTMHCRDNEPLGETDYLRILEGPIAAAEPKLKESLSGTLITKEKAYEGLGNPKMWVEEGNILRAEFARKPLLTAYTLGFLLSIDNKVALIRKERPTWQAGKLNGIGGHVEENESITHCMSREFLEETIWPYKVPEWRHYAVLEGRDFVVYCFTGITDTLKMIGSKTSEKVEVMDIKDIHPLNRDVINPWLVSAAYDFLTDNHLSYITAKF